MVRPSRVAVVHVALLLFAAALLLRAGQLQLWEGEGWAAKAERQHVTAASVPAPRGEIRDAAGVSLASSRAMVRLSIAPSELADRGAASRALAKAGVPNGWIARSVDRRRRWVTLPGHYPISDVAPLLAMRGVYGTPVVDRLYAPSSGIAALVGRLDNEGRGADGLELALDSLLRGMPGQATILRDARGRRFESPTTTGVAPQPGHSVTLTVNYELQEIVDRALADAMTRMSAEGGDIVVLDPHDGAILAMASRRGGRPASAATAVTEPFEPGSTLKPFIAAGLLARDRARADEVIETFDGRYELDGRTIQDLHRERALSLHDVIRWSSNVGIVRFAQRLTPREQYETLRDFGFGAPTLLPYPAEASGTLREPARWSRQSRASLAMGYEIAVTPLQLALAYASIANGGELLEPMLIRDIRTAEGDAVYRARRRVVRRAIDEKVSEAIRGMLVDVVANGTAVQADLSTFAVGGKTGTARRVRGSAGYAQGEYFATFVGLFPAESPQYVVLTKLDNPAGIYGGATAAPVSRVVLEAALAARDAALDRGRLPVRRLAAIPREAVFQANGELAAEPIRALAPVVEPEPEAAPPASVVFTLPAAPTAAPSEAPGPRPVPDVAGMPLRRAVRELHRAGFRVRLTPGTGSTSPSPRSFARPGALVLLPAGR